jgi:hypothetical protein
MKFAAYGREISSIKKDVVFKDVFTEYKEGQEKEHKTIMADLCELKTDQKKQLAILSAMQANQSKRQSDQ